MSAHKISSQRAKAPVARTAPRRKKARSPRDRLIHIEVRRGEALCLRVAIAKGVMPEAGEALGALIMRISPGTAPAPAPVQATDPEPAPEAVVIGPDPGFHVSRAHYEHDVAYHAELREHLVDLFGSLCDSSLEDALDVARQERDRRGEGAN